ncbi:MAG: hypothetical protein WA294_06070 [Acidobacteriaceae bacterium]
MRTKSAGRPFIGARVSDLIQPPINVWIPAIDHGVQLRRAPLDSANLMELKDRLEAIPREGTAKGHIEFVAEESKLGSPTIAQGITNTAASRIPWLNIMMSNPERDAAGIREAPGYYTQIWPKSYGLFETRT